MNRIAITTVAAAALLALSACGTPATKTDSPATAAPETSQAATAAPTPSAPPKTNSNNSLIVKFGETFTYADKLSVTIKHVSTAVGSQYAAPATARGAEVQVFEITLTNGSDKSYEPAGFYDTAVFGKTGTKAEKVFDSGQNVSAGYFTGVMLPGATQTIQTALAVPTAELNTIVYSIQPSFAHKAVAVTGGL